MRKVSVLTTVLMLGTLVAGAADATLEKMLKHAPDDTSIAVVVPNLQGVMDGVRNYAKAIGVPEEEMDDDFTAAGLLEEIFEEGAAHIDASGPFVVAMEDPEGFPVAMARAKDVAALREALDVSDSGDGILIVDKGYTENYMLIDGDIVIMAMAEEGIEACQDSTGKCAKQVMTHAGKLIEDYHAVMYFDVKGFRPIIEQNMMMAQAMLPMMMAGADMPPTTFAMIKFFFDKMSNLVREVDGAILALKIDGDIGHLHSAALLDPDGDLAKYLAGIKPADKHLLRGLPNVNAPMVFAYEWDTPAGAESLIGEMFQVMRQSIESAEVEDAEAIKQALDISEKMIAGLTGNNMLILATEEGTFAGAGNYFVKDPRSYVENTRKLQDPELMSAYMSLFQPKMDVNLTRSEKTIAGVQTDYFEIAFDAESDDPMMQQAMMGMQMLYGDAMHWCLAPHKDHVLFAVGGADSTSDLFEACVNMKGGELAQAAGVKAAMDRMPAKPQACALIDPGAMVGMFIDFAEKMGEGPPEGAGKPKTGGDLVAMGMYLKKEAISFEIVVPAASLRPTVDYIQKVEEMERKRWEEEYNSGDYDME